MLPARGLAALMCQREVVDRDDLGAGEFGPGRVGPQRSSDVVEGSRGVFQCLCGSAFLALTTLQLTEHELSPRVRHASGSGRDRPTLRALFVRPRHVTSGGP